MLKRFFGLLCLLATVHGAAAQDKVVPEPEAMTGDYIIRNYKRIEGSNSLLLSEMRDMKMTLQDDDSLLFEGFYMKGEVPFKAAYDAQRGHLSIPAGTLVWGYDDGQGSRQWLYNWNELDYQVDMRPITYRYQGNDTWRCKTTVVLMTGPTGGQLQPYIFSYESEIRRANATTHNLSFVDDYDLEGNPAQQKWDETRPSYVEMEGNLIRVYNLLTKDQFGYGCMLQLSIEPDGRVWADPPVIADQQTNIERPYKALAGCEYDEATNRPTGFTYPNTPRYGEIEGTIDLEAGTLTLNPMAVWTASVTNEGLLKIYDDMFYEFVRSVEVSFTLPEPPASAVPGVEAGEAKTVVRTEYYTLTGQLLGEPRPGEFCIKKTYYDDHTTHAEKMYWRE